MKLDSVGIVVAVRELDLDDDKKIYITIGTPQEFPEGGNFYCPYKIDGLGDGSVYYAGGVDAVQALELTLKRIGTDLYTSTEFTNDRLRHLGMRNLGFPVPSSITDLVPPENE